MKDIIGDLISGKLFGKVKELIDEVVTTKEEGSSSHKTSRVGNASHRNIAANAG
jgi:hypothetical protein